MISKEYQSIVLIFTIIYSSSYSTILAHGFTLQERKALDEFRPLVNKYLVEERQRRDDYLITWLKAKEMRIPDAVEMLKDNLKWRRQYRMRGILNETILEFNPLPYVIEGYSKKGNPMLFYTPTHIDLRKLIIQGNKDKVIRYWYQMLEKGSFATYNAPKAANGENITQAVAVLDLHGYNLKQHFCLECISVYTEWFTGLEKRYPESLKHFVIINIPRIAQQLIDIILPLLSPNTHRALRMFPPDKKEWSSYLLKIIDADQLPYRFGGTKKST